MNTAATEALNHYTKEQGETAALLASRNTAESTYNTENGKVAALVTL